jgi:VWFA-related protein
MRLRSIRSWLSAACALFVVLNPQTGALVAQGQAPPSPGARPTFRASTDLVATDVIVRDGTGQFVADLTAADFELLEDGIRQQIATFALVHGGRLFAQPATTAPADRREGILVPQARPTSDASGRVFILFIDDLHLDFRMTVRAQAILRRILHTLIHDGDMFGIVSSGTSSISQQLTYDRSVLEDAIARVQGEALRPDNVLRSSWGAQGPVEVRHRAHVAFATLNELLGNLEKIQNRRKAILFLSSGYDFNPYERTRIDEQVKRLNTTTDALMRDPSQITAQSQASLNEADLIGEMTYVVQRANRANATIYPIDPRGLIAGQDIDQEIDAQDFTDTVRKTQASLRVLGEETGGGAIVNQNDFDAALARIDSETSDYYLLYFYSSNPDPTKRNRRLTVNVPGRGELRVGFRHGYLLSSGERPR